MKYKIKIHCKQPCETRIECSREIMIPHDWHCSIGFGALSYSVFVWQLTMCNWHLLLCPFPLNFFSTFAPGSFTESAVSRNAFIFNCTLDPKLLKFVLHVEEPRLLPNSSWSQMKMFLKYLNHFSNTTWFSHWI